MSFAILSKKGEPEDSRASGCSTGAVGVQPQWSASNTGYELSLCCPTVIYMEMPGTGSLLFPPGGKSANLGPHQGDESTQLAGNGQKQWSRTLSERPRRQIWISDLRSKYSHHAPTSTSSKTCTTRQTTTQREINTVFLAVGYENPAFDPHSLIIAGDVEQNPGTHSTSQAASVSRMQMCHHSSPSTPSIYLQPSAMREELPQGRKMQ